MPLHTGQHWHRLPDNHLDSLVVSINQGDLFTFLINALIGSLLLWFKSVILYFFPTRDLFLFYFFFLWSSFPTSWYPSVTCILSWYSGDQQETIWPIIEKASFQSCDRHHSVQRSRTIQLCWKIYFNLEIMPDDWPRLPRILHWEDLCWDVCRAGRIQLLILSFVFHEYFQLTYFCY